MFSFLTKAARSEWAPASVLDALKDVSREDVWQITSSGYFIVVQLDAFSRDLLLGLTETKRDEEVTRTRHITLGLQVASEEEITIDTRLSMPAHPELAAKQRWRERLLELRCFLQPLAGSASTPRPFSLGRAGSNDIVLRHPSVSASHAHIHSGSTIMVRDAGSRNGTLINGEPVRGPRLLQDGDSIKLGAVQMWLCDASALWDLLHR